MKINPYLNFNGNAEAAFQFYQSVFGGEFPMLERFKAVPGLPGLDLMTEQEKEGIMHIALPVGDSMLMASDAVPSLGHPKVEGNNFYISLDVDSKAEANRIFNALSEGGTIEMPMGDMFWNAYFGMFADKFGIRWMVSYSYPTAGEN